MKNLIRQIVKEEVNSALDEMPRKPHEPQDRGPLEQFQSLQSFYSNILRNQDFHRDWAIRYSRGIHKTLRDFGIDPTPVEVKIGKRDDEVVVKLDSPEVAQKLADELHNLRSRGDFEWEWPDEVHGPDGNTVTFWYD